MRPVTNLVPYVELDMASLMKFRDKIVRMHSLFLCTSRELSLLGAQQRHAPRLACGEITLFREQHAFRVMTGGKPWEHCVSMQSRKIENRHPRRSSDRHRRHSLCLLQLVTLSDKPDVFLGKTLVPKLELLDVFPKAVTPGASIM